MKQLWQEKQRKQQQLTLIPWLLRIFAKIKA
jgi:hypothetical protein